MFAKATSFAISCGKNKKMAVFSFSLDTMLKLCLFLNNENIKS